LTKPQGFNNREGLYTHLEGENRVQTVENPQQTAGNRQALSFIFSYIKKHIPSVISGVFVLMGVDLIQIIIPRIIQRTVDVLGSASFSNRIIAQKTIIILALALGMVVLRFFWRVLIMGASRKIEREVREDMFSHLQGLGFSFYNRTQTGGLMALMINDVNAIRMATGPSFLALTDALFMGTLSLVFLFSTNARLALFAVMPLPFIIFMITKFGPMIQTRFKAVQESFGTISTNAQESFSGIRVVKGFVQERHEKEGFEKTCDEYVERNMGLIRIWGFFFPAVTLFANLSLTILYLVGGKAVITGVLSFGELISSSMYLGLLIWPVIAIGWVFTLLQRGIASSKRILELINTKPDVFEHPSVDTSIGRLDGFIEIRGLTFGYGSGDRNVLSDVTLSLPSGASLGIMGKPGSGKSTLVSLLFRLFPLPEQRIFIDGQEIHRIPLAVLRGCIGYVPQDPFLFSDTIQNNIGFGVDEDGRVQSDIERLARLVAIDDEIGEFSEGYDTLIGERGVTLSGGQKQRISIARALIKRPGILILDDALSSVDAATEKVVLKNIRSVMGGHTCIIISHRVSTVQECDGIIILEDGRISERGNHTELLRLDGYYRRLYELQKLEEELPGHSGVR
jgi:ATP-binding cassette subfamily B multidrug efflux pump